MAEPILSPEQLVELVGGMHGSASDTASERSGPASSSSHHSSGGSSASSASGSTTSDEGDAGASSPAGDAAPAGAGLAVAAEDNPRRADYYVKRKYHGVYQSCAITVLEVSCLSDAWSGGVLCGPTSG